MRQGEACQESRRDEMEGGERHLKDVTEACTMTGLAMCNYRKNIQVCSLDWNEGEELVYFKIHGK